MESSWNIVKRLLRTEGKPHAFMIGWGIICMVFVALTTAAMAQLMEPIINKIFIEKNATTLYSLIAIIFVTFFVKSAATYGESWAMGAVGQKIVTSFQSKLYDHILKLPYGFFQHHVSGTLVSRFINDVKLLEGTVTQTVSSLVKDALTIIALSGVMFYHDWELAIIALILFPLAMLPLARLGRRMRKTATSLQSTIGDITALLTQSFQGIRLIKAYHIENYESERMQASISDFLKRSLKGIHIKSLSHPIMELAGGIAIVIIIGYWGYKIIHYHESPGAFFAFITALLMMYEPAKRMAKLHTHLQESLSAATRLYEIMDMPLEQNLQGEDKNLTIQSKGLVFQNVSFSYEEGKNKWALEGVNLTISEGEYVAIVGPSGAGKSTLLNLILNFYPHYSGQIFWNQKEIRAYSLQDLRSQIGLVSQEVTLFNDTIEANIAMGVLGLTDQVDKSQIIKAAEAAAASDFIENLPQKYETVVGERGGKLSGGQRQRLALARALVRPSCSILLLDEATSALDSQSEQVIQKTLDQLKGKKTILVIAHRLSTIQNADRIILMDQGRIISEGTHEMLLKNSSLYVELCRHQFSKAS